MSNITTFTTNIASVLTVVEEILVANPDGMSVPEMVMAVANKLNLSADETKNHEMLIRYYLKNHSIFTVSRGAHGGVIPRSRVKPKKIATPKVIKTGSPTTDAVLATLQNRANNDIDSDIDENDGIDLDEETDTSFETDTL